MPKLRAENLTKKYPPARKGNLGLRDLWDTLKGRREEVLALDNVSLEVNPGEWFGILGPNGAGKTTFCDIILDITTPTSGRILYEDHDVTKEHSYTKSKICMMQYWFIRERISVRETLRRNGAEWRLTPEETDEKIEDLANRFGITNKLDDWYIRLSSGTQIKVMMISTLMSGAELLIFDEPTPWLDVFTRRNLYKQLIEYQQKHSTTILWTTHNLHEAQKVCNRIAVIDNHLITVTTPNKLINDMRKADLEEAFIELLEDQDKNDKNRM